MDISIKMVVLDMAGTTVDEQNVVYKTLQKAINNAGYQISLKEVLATGAGMEKLQAIQSILQVYASVDDSAIAHTIFDNFEQLLDAAYKIYPIQPQPNAVEALQALKVMGITVVLNTGYSARVAGIIIDKLGWKKGIQYDDLITASDVVAGRPAPDMIYLAAEKFGVNTTQIVKVGDSVIDIEEGKNAGCALSIGITTGAHTIDQLKVARPDYIINNLMELLSLV